MYILKNNVPIFGYAMSKKDLKNVLDDIGYNIIEHIVKLYFYRNKGATRHWRREIFSFLHRVSVLKHNHKLPSSDFLYENLYHVNSNKIGRIVLSVTQWYVDEYGDSDVAVNDDSISDVTDMISRYLKWLSENLSRTGDVTPNEVYNQLDALGLSDK